MSIRASLGTLGGIKINHRTNLIREGKVIPGLYAVGLDAGGMYGTDGYNSMVPGSTLGFQR